MGSRSPHLLICDLFPPYGLVSHDPWDSTLWTSSAPMAWPPGHLFPRTGDIRDPRFAEPPGVERRNEWLQGRRYVVGPSVPFPAWRTVSSFSPVYDKATRREASREAFPGHHHPQETANQADQLEHAEMRLYDGHLLVCVLQQRRLVLLPLLYHRSGQQDRPLLLFLATLPRLSSAVASPSPAQ
ncbi:epididymal protein 13 isoform X1 [Ursus maritimus]|uniref:Epididymal protein 13 isoform X1 n=1 Tax=Ursus maritimus TaxID=29073 RepID=A0A384DMC1_URSMA|nr:epididymal protein 13 isoform X1 [Ursus maritimus]